MKIYTALLCFTKLRRLTFLHCNILKMGQLKHRKTLYENADFLYHHQQRSFYCSFKNTLTCLFYLQTLIHSSVSQVLHSTKQHQLKEQLHLKTFFLFTKLYPRMQQSDLHPSLPLLFLSQRRPVVPIKKNLSVNIKLTQYINVTNNPDSSIFIAIVW